MYVNPIPFQDQARDLISAIEGIPDEQSRLIIAMQIEEQLISEISLVKQKLSYELVKNSLATDAAIEAGIDPRKLHRLANKYANENGLPRRRLRLHRFDPREAVHLQVVANRPDQEVPIHPSVSPGSPLDPDIA